MIRRYKKSILFLLDSLHEARREPFQNIEKWLALQENLIKRIIYVENRIRSNKKEIKDLNFYRKKPNKRVPKEESILLKERIRTLKNQIESYKTVIQIYQSIGDGIAFTFIHKFDIKPQNFKQKAGFISQKKGFTKEKQVLRYSFKKKQIAILNDITSVLRYSDIILITENGIKAIEVKSSDNVNKRVQRQKDNAEKLFDYLSNDVSIGLYQENLVMQRIESSSLDVDYIKDFNLLIARCNGKGIKAKIFEKGMLCIVAHNHFDKKKLDKIVSESDLKKPFGFNINSHKFTEQGYYPFSLSFEKSESYWDFIIGGLNILFLVDLNVIEDIATKNGFKVNVTGNMDYGLDFINVSNSIPVEKIKMSHHYINRTVMEFASLKWLTEQTFNQFDKVKEMVAKKNLP